ncbi:MAG: RsmE family RNA methyltransferase [Spirochaetales bacterium]|nr:RsmE family RNA methyltransferase [Spirochaetales bacterium]
MNLILFDHDEAGYPLKRGDDRYEHIRTILKAREGDLLEGGILNGPRKQIRLDRINGDTIEYTLLPAEKEDPPLAPLTLLIGCPRPPTARRLVKDLVSLGVGRLIFTDTDLNEKSYLQAKFWRDGLYEKAAREGAMQGKSTRLPPIDRYFSLKKAMESLPEGQIRRVPDLVEGDKLTASLPCPWPEKQGACAAIGPERGWTDRERQMLAEGGFLPVTLGNRVMRTESAAIMTAGVFLLQML